MSRGKKLMLNTTSSIVLQLITVIVGFILPKLYLTYYGSEVNGLVSSITQYLGFISLAEFGVGAVTQSALYKPLAERNEDEISRIIISSERFFRKLGCVLLVYCLLLIFVYPYMIDDSFSWWFTTSLILAIVISTFAQYYFSMSYRLLLLADQLGYIQIGFQILTLIINTILNIMFVINGFSIQIVKLSTSIIFLLQPLGIHFYVKRHYKINKNIKLIEEPINQKWNGLAQHVAAVVVTKTDVAVLTFFSLASVSVYNVYYIVVYGIQAIIESISNGIQSLLGNIYAKKEMDLLNKTFSLWEWSSHAIITFLYSCTGILIVPFVRVYTNGITDANYIVPVFATLLTVAYAFFCLRYPYTTMIKVAGHYKQTQMSCIIEAGINVIFSIILVCFWWISGVAVATLLAMIYRTMYCVFYLNKHILFRPIKYYFKNLAVDIMVVLICITATSWIQLGSITWISWIIMASKVSSICFIIMIVVNSIFYFNNMKSVGNILKKKLYINNKKL
ncbi:polysaccharide biosynthesis C-terminal domain-containing protein [Clostridium perfringens]|nr:hypothetical protein CPBEC3_19490 [Clostridium perfringens]HCG3172928.1 polysaccharide biosynthesis C-terminal domain-containing protein [Clostridium perfringens]